MNKTVFVLGILLGIGSSPWASASPARSEARAVSPVDLVAVRSALADHSARFVAESGGGAFSLRVEGGSVRFSSRGIAFVRETTGSVADVELVGASPSVGPHGVEPLAARVSYFEGSASEWRTNLSTYASVRYDGLWPGVDLVFRTSEGRLKYEFVVAPGADPGRVRLRCAGASAIRLASDGRIEIESPAGTLVDEAPVSFQEREGRRTPVATAYEVDPAEKAYCFRLAAYDRTRPLTIDPSIVFAGFVGGTSSDSVLDAAVGPDGSVYVVGATGSKQDSLPVTTGPDLTFNPFQGSGLLDAFVAKIKPDGSGIDYLGYIGGDLTQIATGVAVDAQGNAYVVGVTNSDNRFSHFPATVGPRLQFASEKTLDEGFVAKVSADGTRLVYCGYIGGVSLDEATDVAVDGQGNAYVVGLCASASGFPVAGGPRTTFGGGVVDGFLAKVKADGTGFVYSGFIGGSGRDEAYGVAVGSDGSAYVTGRTDSTNLTVAGGPQLAYGGGLSDAFVAKVPPSGSGFTYLGYLGGSRADGAVRVAVGSDGAAYVGGATTSAQPSFPVKVGPDLTFNGDANGSTADGFVAKVAPDGAGLVYCGYIGGSDNDSVSAIAVDGTGRLSVTGTTQSTEATFPTSGGLDGTFNGSAPTSDAFFAEVKADGSGLASSGYIGGSDDDVGTGVALDGAGNAYVVGVALSTATTFPVRGGLSQTNSGITDVFIAKISGGPPGPQITAVRKEGKFLVVEGENFDRGAKILVNGTAYKTKAAGADLKSKKAGKVVKPGDAVKVRNADGSESNELTFDG